MVKKPSPPPPPMKTNDQLLSLNESYHYIGGRSPNVDREFGSGYFHPHPGGTYAGKAQFRRTDADRKPPREKLPQPAPGRRPQTPEEIKAHNETIMKRNDAHIKLRAQGLPNIFDENKINPP